jgi:23S rRNA (cytosine1962-C5)-methyltransferase
MGEDSKSGKGSVSGRGSRGRKRSPRHRGRLPYSPSAGDGVIVNGYSEEWQRKGFPWVYRDEVLGRTGSMVPGRVVQIRNRKGEILGTGIWDDSGKIEVRRFRHDEGPIDSELLGLRLKAALDARPMPELTTAWRWIHGENDLLPGVRIDVWDRHLSISLDSDSLGCLLEPLIAELTRLREVDGVWLTTRGVDSGSGRKLSQGQIWGSPHSGEVEVMERGTRIQVYLGEGQDTGLFCDMRELRTWLESHWTGRRVLNTFAHTGMFSVVAAQHGAAEVISVDLSQRYMDRALHNFRLNGLLAEPHSFLVEDSFKVLDRYRRKGDFFDLVIADPPTLSHSPDGDWFSKGGFPRLVQACSAVTRSGGWMVFASNQGSVSPKDFQRAIQQGARKAGCQLRIIHQGSPPLDFPAALDFPESRYLKVWVLQLDRQR